MSDDDELGSLVLHQSCDVVQAIFQDHGFLCLCLLTILFLLGHLHKAVLFCLARLWHVLLAELQHMSCLILINGTVELVDGRWDFQPHQHDLLGSLKTYKLWPLDESRQITLGLDVTTNAVTAWGLLEKRILLNLLLLVCTKGCLGQVLLRAGFAFWGHGFLQ